ncbi:hypothetical protein [Pelosinus sp. UFO1]|uniref:hypothetical protein n=1 Tax=Pelosinus sp. UFO1 TaxID=484770 RepID=UPI001186639F|nr:hypothetical protein [Pelosinus sp. UFO1]
MERFPSMLLEVQPEINVIWNSFDKKTKKYWDEIQATLNNTLIVPGYQSAEINKNNYATNQLVTTHPIIQQETGYSYFILLYLNRKEAQMYDVAHELAHIEVVTMHGYSYLMLKSQVDSDHIGNLTPHISLVCDVAIHPVIDGILKERRLFSDKFYQRKYTGILNGLERAAKAFAISSKINFLDAFIIIEAKHRLRKHIYKQIVNRAESMGLNPLISFAQKLPLFEFNHKDPRELDAAILATCKEIEIDLDSLGLFQLVNRNSVPFG